MRSRPGAVPGIELSELEKMPCAGGDVYVSCIDYCPDQFQAQPVQDLEEFLAHHRPAWSTVRWINIDGLTDMGVIHAVAKKYNLHPLAIEDLLNTSQRPKVDSYPAEGELQARLFISARMAEMLDGGVRSEQVSLFLGHKTVLTFQEKRGDVWGPIRQRIATAGSRLRGNDASFLVYSLLDAIVDQCFPMLEHYGERLEELEAVVLDKPTQETIRQIHQIKRELLLVRRAVWPMREVVRTLQDETHECFSPTARTYMRDVYDHLVQIIEVLETYREMASGLTETYMSAANNRMSEIMKVLTLIGTIFIPLTFLAGVYGMNFHYMPEMNAPWAYPVFWIACVGLAIAMVTWFRHRGWL
jgi:magnesium transporter